MSTGSSMNTTAQRLAKVETKIQQEADRVSRNAGLIGLIGTILIVAMICYFYYGYQKLKEATEPKEMVTLIDGLVTGNIETTRVALESEIEERAPELAEQLSEELQAGIPKGRETLEQMILDEFDRQTDKYAVMSVDEFDTFLDENRALIQRSMNDLEKSPKLTQEALELIVTQFERQTNQDLKRQVLDVLNASDMMNRKLKRLAIEDDAKAARVFKDDREARVQRRILMIAKRLKLEAADPTLLDRERKAAELKKKLNAKSRGNGSKGDTSDSESKPDEGANEQPDGDSDPEEAAEGNTSPTEGSEAREKAPESDSPGDDVSSDSAEANDSADEGDSTEDSPEPDSTESGSKED